MKNLIRNIWDAPASTIAAGLTGAIAIFLSTGTQMPNWLIITLSATSAFLAVFSGPNKPNQ